MKLITKKLNKKDLATYYLGRNLIYFIAIILLVFFSYKIIFPSKQFVFSFAHTNSLKNTITNVILANHSLKFYASTPQEFSKINLEIELNKKNTTLNNKKVSLQKSYKDFFYPKGAPLSDLKNVSENKLVSSGISVFVIGHNKKYPINNPTTFEALGYKWDSIESGEHLDLSKYKKQKLMTINSPHPDGTIFKTDTDKYYYVENSQKRLLSNIVKSKLETIRNPIFVNEKSLNISDVCSLKKEILSAKKYHCLIPIDKTASLIGKDYLFKINNFPNNLDLKQINISFEKSVNKKNLELFISNLKKRILMRFGYETNT
ncbi:MAG TPA: hypothetical protein ENJ27_00280 [Candidatus Moranbacteria bacterium]|nr:hypothetical protein [Candidatus Moranbacteria bacterium]